MAEDRFAMLFVCHANLCRSPMAERLARAAIDRRFGPGRADIDVASAGTHARVGSGMHPDAFQVLGEFGVDAAGFTSRQLTPYLLANADLVLTADRTQRAACVTMAPGAVGRTFTIRQFARMAAASGPQARAAGETPGVTAETPGVAAETPAAALRIAVDQVVRGRARLQPVPPTDDDLADPVRQPIDAFRACAAEVQRSLDAILGAVTAC